MLYNLVRCRACGRPLSYTSEGKPDCCHSALVGGLRNGFLIYDANTEAVATPEMHVRDDNALNYMSHPKFPTQIERLRSFLRAHPPMAQGDKVLDLGCGPGPTTELLLQAGFEVAAVDFSIRSLSINAYLCGEMSEKALFVHADLNLIEFTDASVDGLMMADFLQHLGGRETQRAFLGKAFRALKPGGWFYLSFFNTNIFHRLRGDTEGTRGNIGYRRLSLRDVQDMLPLDIQIDKKSVMNIVNGATLDRVATHLPFAQSLAQMAVIEGRRTA